MNANPGLVSNSLGSLVRLSWESDQGNSKEKKRGKIFENALYSKCYIHLSLILVLFFLLLFVCQLNTSLYSDMFIFFGWEKKGWDSDVRERPCFPEAFCHALGQLTLKCTWERFLDSAFPHLIIHPSSIHARTYQGWERFFHYYLKVFLAVTSSETDHLFH